MPPWEPGTQVGPYTLLGRLGSGGMGEVWKARDTRLDRIVAIKQLKGQHSARFQQEARAIAALNHPNICQIYDVGPDYLVLEYVDGAPVQGPMATPEAVRVALQITGALEAAHAKKILHRDLKPGNILMSAAGAKLLDFGLAKLFADQDATLTMGVAGTPLYMSPEQAEGKQLDAHSDIFSFGVVFYELLAGRRAFDSLAAVLRDEPRPLTTVPPGLQAIVTRCLRKNPADRFASFKELRAALEGSTVLPVERQPSIAVLPFANVSGDKEQEYFSDGLAEEIINQLVKISGLKVIARTSSFAFKGQNTDIRQIAETLGVTNILEGSVRRGGSRIRVTAQLITAADGSHLWSERYDRELVDVFAIQDEISAAISEALQVKLSPQTAAKRHSTPKLPAHEALLKARHYRYKITPASLDQAKIFYQQAIALDPQYALAHALFADYLLAQAVVGITPAREAMPAVRAMAQRALDLDPLLPEAHAALGVVASAYDYEWKEAERHFTMAICNDASSPWCHFLRGNLYLFGTGRRQEAVDELARAVQADPLNLIQRQTLAYCLSSVGRHVEAEQHIRYNLELEPTFYWSHAILANIHAARHMFKDALPCAEKAYSLAPWFSWVVGTYAGLLVVTGERERGNAVAQELLSCNVEAAFGWMVFYSYCGEIDQAADWAERAIQARYPQIGFVLQGILGEPLRASPHWPKLAALMNLPAVAS